MAQSANPTDVDQIKEAALSELEKIDDLQELEQWRVSYLGRRGTLTQVLRSLGSAAPEDRRRIGAEANGAKTLLEESLAQREETIEQPQQDVRASKRPHEAG